MGRPGATLVELDGQPVGLGCSARGDEVLRRNGDISSGTRRCGPADQKGIARERDIFATPIRFVEIASYFSIDQSEVAVSSRYVRA